MKKRKETKERDGLLLEGSRRRRAEGEDWPVNVWEWCEDVYDEGFYKKPEARETDPCSDKGSMPRIIRGGCRALGARSCRSAYRDWLAPSLRPYDLGCRLARRWP